MLCGFATFRAESLWLSVKPSTLLAAAPPEAKPLLFLRSERKARGFPHGYAAKPQSMIADEYGHEILRAIRLREAPEKSKLLYNEGVLRVRCSKAFKP